MVVVYALGAALAWGTSDFAAGYVSRRVSVVSVVLLTHLASLAAMSMLTIDFPSIVDGGPGLPNLKGDPTNADLAWGAVSGFSGGCGGFFLFRGLSRGAMAVVAPITAAGASIIPVVVGVATGDRLTAPASVGIGLAVVAIVLISLTGSGADEPAAEEVAASGVAGVLRRPGVSDALLAGLGFGFFFVFISRASDGAGWWPLLAARGVSIPLFVAVAVVAGERFLPGSGSRLPIVAAGLLDGVANSLFVLSSRAGLLSIAAVVSSMYPGFTVVLARFVAGEAIVRRQAAGLALAAVAVGLLAV